MCGGQKRCLQLISSVFSIRFFSFFWQFLTSFRHVFDQKSKISLPIPLVIFIWNIVFYNIHAKDQRGNSCFKKFLRISKISVFAKIHKLPFRVSEGKITKRLYRKFSLMTPYIGACSSATWRYTGVTWRDTSVTWLIYRYHGVSVSVTIPWALPLALPLPLLWSCSWPLPWPWPWPLPWSWPWLWPRSVTFIIMIMVMDLVTAFFTGHSWKVIRALWKIVKNTLKNFKCYYNFLQVHSEKVLSQFY